MKSKFLLIILFLITSSRLTLYPYAISERETLIIRYDNIGVLDKSFGNEGVVRTMDEGPGGDWAAGCSLILDNESNIFILGRYIDSLGYPQNWFIRKYTENGSLDPDFGENGIFTYDNSEKYTAYKDYANTFLADARGRILAAGMHIINNQGKNISIWGFTPKGILDESFGINGQATYSFPETEDKWETAHSIQFDSQGRIVP